MTDDEKIAIIEDILELPSGTLNTESALEDFEEWDSLAVLSLTVYFDSELGKILDSKAIRSFKTVQDIIDLM